MIKLHKWLRNNNMKSTMIMQVHDEIVLEVAENELAEVSKQTNLIMSQACELKVPLLVSIGTGHNWLEAH